MNHRSGHNLLLALACVPVRATFAMLAVLAFVFLMFADLMDKLPSLKYTAQADKYNLRKYLPWWI